MPKSTDTGDARLSRRARSTTSNVTKPASVTALSVAYSKDQVDGDVLARAFRAAEKEEPQLAKSEIYKQ